MRNKHEMMRRELISTIISDEFNCPVTSRKEDDESVVWRFEVDGMPCRIRFQQFAYMNYSAAKIVGLLITEMAGIRRLLSDMM